MQRLHRSELHFMTFFFLLFIYLFICYKICIEYEFARRVADRHKKIKYIYIIAHMDMTGSARFEYDQWQLSPSCNCIYTFLFLFIRSPAMQFGIAIAFANRDRVIRNSSTVKLFAWMIIFKHSVHALYGMWSSLCRYFKYACYKYNSIFGFQIMYKLQ